MHIQHHTIASLYIPIVLQGAIRQGYDPQLILKQAGLSPNLLTPSIIRIPPAQFADLVKTIWQTLDDEFLGLAAKSCRLGTFALMAEYSIHAATLGEALERSAHFYRVLSDQFCLQLSHDGQEAHLSLDQTSPDYDADHFLLEFTLLSWSRLAHWLIGRRIPLLRACFAYPAPMHVAEYPHLFPCRLLFDQPRTELVFAADWLHRPVERTSLELKLLLKQLPAEFFIKPVFHGSYTQRVRQLINEDMTTGFPTLEAVAEHFWLTGRTLRRKLLREGSSYQDIKDRIRRDQAVQLLVSGDLSLHEIALRLGFSETSAFIRAFKLWTGVTPRQYLITSENQTAVETETEILPQSES